MSKEGKVRKKKGYYKDIENLKNELRPIIKKLSKFPSQTELNSMGKVGLRLGIIRGQGGFIKLKKKLEEWTIDILKEKSIQINSDYHNKDEKIRDFFDQFERKMLEFYEEPQFWLNLSNIFENNNKICPELFEKINSILYEIWNLTRVKKDNEVCMVCEEEFQGPPICCDICEADIHERCQANYFIIHLDYYANLGDMKEYVRSHYSLNICNSCFEGCSRCKKYGIKEWEWIADNNYDLSEYEGDNIYFLEEWDYEDDFFEKPILYRCEDCNKVFCEDCFDDEKTEYCLYCVAKLK